MKEHLVRIKHRRLTAAGAGVLRLLNSHRHPLRNYCSLNATDRVTNTDLTGSQTNG